MAVLRFLEDAAGPLPPLGRAAVRERLRGCGRPALPCPALPSRLPVPARGPARGCPRGPNMAAGPHLPRARPRGRQGARAAPAGQAPVLFSPGPAPGTHRQRRGSSGRRAQRDSGCRQQENGHRRPPAPHSTGGKDSERLPAPHGHRGKGNERPPAPHGQRGKGNERPPTPHRQRGEESERPPSAQRRRWTGAVTGTRPVPQVGAGSAGGSVPAAPRAGLCPSGSLAEPGRCGVFPTPCFD